MMQNEHWIGFPGAPCNSFSLFNASHKNDVYAVYAFRKSWVFRKPIRELTLEFSGDAYFSLHLNGKILADGPAGVGGDFLFNDLPRSRFYATKITVGGSFCGLSEGNLSFTAYVRQSPERMFEYSQGTSGFCLFGKVIFLDGTSTEIRTDESWTATHLTAYTAPRTYDGRHAESSAVSAVLLPERLQTEIAPIPPCTHEILYPKDADVTVFPHTKRELVLPFDMVYAGYVAVSCLCGKDLKIALRCVEDREDGSLFSLRFTGADEYIGKSLESVGEYRITVENEGEIEAHLVFYLISSFYPITDCAVTQTSDEGLNEVLRVCAHSLKYCRQTLHLDSPRHCEPLACTGDYYIESLMTAFLYGDMRLSAFDIERTAIMLSEHDGRMFHTTYSLIFVLMLWDVYNLSGNTQLLLTCKDGLDKLFSRFERYIGDNGLPEKAPNYMFVDWLNPDGVSTHHPPKALGQTCLSLFYYGALQVGRKIYEKLQLPEAAKKLRLSAERLQEAIIKNLYDGERKLFFEGLNTPTPDELLEKYMPQNVGKRYYRRHANILAAYFGIFPKEESASLLRRTLEDNTLGEVQPYFRHFLLDAVLRNGLRDEYTLLLLEDWKRAVRECPKGLPEGFYKPEPNYHFDHSHAWAGTPAYALPMALTGLRIEEAGLAKVSFLPSLLGLTWAKVEIPTPYGKITVIQKKGEKTVISAPSEIEWYIREE